MFFDSNMPPFGDSCYPPPVYEGYEPPKGKKDFAPDASDLTITRPLLEEARAAKSALAGLTEGNRLVGIISHVAELKERIDKQIVVKKKKAGGSKAIISV